MSSPKDEAGPLSREELLEMMEPALQRADDAVRAAWERIRIPPERWRCSPWGDETGGFWAVAISGDSVVWFNEIEEGFNISRFKQHGTIDEYLCCQDDFELFLASLPEAHLGERFARKKPALVVPPALESAGTITRRQTTYWELTAGDGTRWRVHFSEKQEFRHTKDTFTRVELHADHPLLRNYDEPWDDLYLAGPAQAPQEALRKLEDSIAATSGGWRAFSDYKRGTPTGRILESGHGLLLSGPRSIVSSASAALESVGARTSVMSGRTSSERGAHRLLLLVGAAYVLAESFRFEPQE